MSNKFKESKNKYMKFIRSDKRWLNDELKKDLSVAELRALSARMSNLSYYQEDVDDEDRKK